MKEKQQCTGCGLCVQVCPVGAISMEPDGEGFLYPKINAELCTQCGLCQDCCPDPQPQCQNTYYGLRHKDEQLRSASSSGGAFGLLAQHVLEQNGVVWAAAFDHQLRLSHRPAQTEAELRPLQRTKYIQSSILDAYSAIDADLKQGRKVLFCGTPCQTAAMRQHLGKERDGLILADLICFGVPSPGFWAAYVSYLETKLGGRLEAVDFRDKRNRDSGHTFSCRAGDQELAIPMAQDPYCRLYMRALSLRPSCYRCPYTTVDRVSDFTIGDFWGGEAVFPEAADGMGLSLLIAHHEKADQLWQELAGNTLWMPITQEQAMQDRLRCPTKAHPLRPVFGRELAKALETGNVSTLVQKFGKV